MNLPASLEEGKSYETSDFVQEHRMRSSGDSTGLSEYKPIGRRVGSHPLAKLTGRVALLSHLLLPDGH